MASYVLDTVLGGEITAGNDMDGPCLGGGPRSLGKISIKCGEYSWDRCAATCMWREISYTMHSGECYLSTVDP